MRYLIDTHTLLWIVTDDPELSETAKKIYLDQSNEIYFSLASIWEMAIKISIGKLSIEKSLQDFTEHYIIENDIKILNIQLPHVIRIEKLPFHHRDPFDRLIIAQGIEDNIPIISSDRIFDLYPIKRLW